MEHITKFGTAVNIKVFVEEENDSTTNSQRSPYSKGIHDMKPQTEFQCIKL